MRRRKRNALTFYSTLLFGALLSLWHAQLEGEETAVLQKHERRLSNKTEPHGKQVDLSPIHSLEQTALRLANQADWHRNVRGHYIGAAAICIVLIYLLHIVVHLCMKRLKYEGLYAVPDYSDDTMSPIQWISTDGDIYEVFSVASRYDSGLDLGLRFRVGKVNCVEPPDEGGDEIFIESHAMSEKDPVSALQGGELLTLTTPDGKFEGALLGNAIHWLSEFQPVGPILVRKSKPWYKCEYGDLSVADPILVLFNHEWREGIVMSFEETSDASKVYVVEIYRGFYDDDIISGVRRERIRKLKITAGDRMSFGAKVFMYYFCKAFDLIPCGIFIRSRQWIYLTFNLFGVFGSALESSRLMDRFFDALIAPEIENLESIFSRASLYAVRDVLTGVAFWRETRQPFFPSSRLLFLHSSEASVKDMVSLLVQTHAFLFTPLYTFTEQCLMTSSIILSAANYAIAVGTDDYEFVVGQNLRTPCAQREFKDLFFVELQLLQLTRMVSMITRTCCVASFCFSFHRFGMFMWLISTISRTYGIFRCIDENMSIGDCIWNAVSLENWLNISEPYLISDSSFTFEDRGLGATRQLVIAMCVGHALENIVMYGLMYMLASEQIGTYLLHGHRCLVFMVGLLGQPLAWVFEGLALWIAASTRFKDTYRG